LNGYVAYAKKGTVERNCEMGKHKTETNGSEKPAQEPSKSAGRRRGPNEKERPPEAVASEANGEELTLDGTRLDIAVSDEQPAGRPWLEVLVDSRTRTLVGMKVTVREVPDEL
jgi:hypothetical protein